MCIRDSDQAANAKLFSNGQGSGTGGSVAIKGGDYTGEFDSALMDAYYDKMCIRDRLQSVTVGLQRGESAEKRGADLVDKRARMG